MPEPLLIAPRPLKGDPWKLRPVTGLIELHPEVPVNDPGWIPTKRNLRNLQHHQNHFTTFNVNTALLEERHVPKLNVLQGKVTM